MEEKQLSKLADLVTLHFGNERYAVLIPRFIVVNYPLINELLSRGPKVNELAFRDKESLTKTQKEGLDFFFTMAFMDAKVEPYELPVIISALQWAQFFKMREETSTMDRLLYTLSRVGSGEWPDEVDQLIHDKFITNPFWLVELGYRKVSPSKRSLFYRC
jgi:hypothetical protein